MRIRILLLAFGLLLFAGCTTDYPDPAGPPVPEINSFEECAAAGYPVMESYPRKCSADGQAFTEILSDEECQKAGTEHCYASCRVCPPCPECSSLSCRSAEFCESMGFTEEWSASVESG